MPSICVGCLFYSNTEFVKSVFFDIVQCPMYILKKVFQCKLYWSLSCIWCYDRESHLGLYRPISALTPPQPHPPPPPQHMQPLPLQPSKSHHCTAELLPHPTIIAIPGQSPMDWSKCSAVTKLNQLGSKIFQLLYLYIKLKPLQIQCGVIWVQK